MHKSVSLAFVILLGIAAYGALPSSAWGAVVYTYTGQNFTQIGDQTPPNGSYNTTMSVTGSFTAEFPVPSLPFADDITALIKSYNFSDGRQTLNNNNSLISAFTVGVDASGVPDNWGISLVTLFPFPAAIGDKRSQILVFAGGDFALIEECTLHTIFNNCASVSQDTASNALRGTWSIATVSPVPLPPALLLFGSALAGLAVTLRRRRRA